MAMKAKLVRKRPRRALRQETMQQNAAMEGRSWLDSRHSTYRGKIGKSALKSKTYRINTV